MCLLLRPLDNQHMHANACGLSAWTCVILTKNWAWFRGHLLEVRLERAFSFQALQQGNEVVAVLAKDELVHFVPEMVSHISFPIWHLHTPGSHW